ncbi:MAG: serine hydrolase [Lachnospiraceae bacterium]|nr:serine hydrolase [Lachnospiraceae bacterium]
MRSFKTKTLLVLTIFSVLASHLLPVRAAYSVIGREDHLMVEPPDYVRPNAPDINSDTAIVIELNSGEILYAKNIHQRMYPASITKIITALIALENLDLEEKLVLSYNSVHDLVEGGGDARGRFYEGQSFSVRDAVYALSLNSVNTVGYALAERTDGSLDAFSERMNARARALGAINTTFHNPHGLNDLLHMTTAYDMAMIMWGAIQNDLYRQIAGTRSYSFSDEDGHLIVCDHNYLVFQPDSPYYDSRIVAGKTGWVEEAEYTRTVYAKDGDLDIICVTFHADTTERAYEDVRVLLDYAFNNYSRVELPRFGENGELTAAVQDERTGEAGSIHFTAGEANSVTGAALVVPNSYARRDWSTELLPNENGELRAVASLGGVVLGSYPLHISITRETPPATEAPESQPQSQSLPSTSGSSETKSPSGTSASATGKQTSAPATKPPGRSSETEAEQGGGSGWKTVLIVLLGVLLACTMGYAAILAHQNKILKERVRRRRVIKKQDE